MLGADLDMTPLAIAALEQRGYDAAFSAEINSDPFFPLVLAAEHSQTIALTTSISVAFARNPMTMANLSWDLNQYSRGRFTVGLGSQIKPHITRRFSMPWSKPAARMRDFILAMRAIWACWETGEKLDFNGEFYQHNLMTPMFTPEDTQYGAPKVFLAAVGPLMTQVAGEVADGVIIHSFSTRKYITDVTLPAIEKGLAKAGRDRSDFQVSYPCFVVTGNTEEEFLATKTAVTKQIAFYGSTPAYRPVLEVHGWGDLQYELNKMSKQGLWDEMGTMITDEILDEFAVVGETDEAVEKFKQRFDGLVDRTASNFAVRDAEHKQAVMQKLKG